MRVVVLLGGTSSERHVSLATGIGVARALQELGHEVLALDPADGRVLELESASGRIAEEPPPVVGRPATPALATHPELLRGDVVFVALHGGSGEDGTIQALLDLAGVPYTGSGVLASALAMDKFRAKLVLEGSGVPTPPGHYLESRERPLDVEALGGFPVVVKPNREGSSVGVHVVGEAGELGPALDEAFRYGAVLAERYIPGREVTVAVLGGEALPAVEIVPEDGFYDYRHKYTRGHTRYDVPASLEPDVARRLAALAETAYAALGCAGVARVDFRLTDENDPLCLEINTVPGLTETSLVPMAAARAGMSYPQLVQRIVDLARAAP